MVVYFVSDEVALSGTYYKRKHWVSALTSVMSGSIVFACWLFGFDGLAQLVSLWVSALKHFMTEI